MPQSTTAVLADGLPRRERLEAIAAISLTVAMANLDGAIANTALPTVAANLGTDGAAAIWVVNAYQVAMLAALLPLAALGEIAGHRRVYVAGLALFTATSLACGLAWSLPSLIVARALQGLGAAAMMSVNTALVRFTYPASMLGRGVGYNALAVAIGITAGPTVASLVLSVASWHWLFLINVPVGLAAIWFGRSLPRTARAKHPFDATAALLCAGLFAPLALGVGAATHGQWPLAAVEWVVALVCGAALMRRQAGHPAPMLAADLFRIPVFALSGATAICSFATQGLAFVSLPFLLQTALGRSQVETGFLITPWPAVVAFMAPIAGRLSDRYPAGLLGGIGLAILAAGMALAARLPDNSSALQIGVAMALCGAGFGFFQSPNLRALMASAPRERSGGASGIVATARLCGQTAGAALVALCLTASPERGPALALWLGCGFAALGCVMSFLRLIAAGPGKR
ncbi:MAG: MFS transporter [Hyphomicrobiales bacterium]|nr:MFS transporter [Hyphomicrobiales bacterium]